MNNIDDIRNTHPILLRFYTEGNREPVYLNFDGKLPFRVISQLCIVKFLQCRWEITKVNGEKCLAVDAQGIVDAYLQMTLQALSYDKQHGRTYSVHLERVIEHGTRRTQGNRDVMLLPLRYWDVRHGNGGVTPGEMPSSGEGV